MNTPATTDSGHWIPDQGNGTYINPIIYADYSDPDVIRVGEDFFMTASSFTHIPGLPILHSRDLVNWRIVNHALPRLELPGYDKVQHGKGVWAPSLRYHEGQFWIFYATPDEGIFMTKTDDPFGAWEPPHLLKAAKGWIDPCPFWDEDGQAYLVHAYAHSRSGLKHILNLCRMSPDGTTLLDDGTIIVDGTVKHPTLEGPKMYKRNGYYYIFAPAGGVPTGWQAVFRSKSIYGPYEDKIVLQQGETPVNGPHQGGWVELASGESWFVHFQDKGAYGRITHLQPMEWRGDWPVMGRLAPDREAGEPVERWKKPDTAAGEVCIPQTSDDFCGAALGLQWQWQANPASNWHRLLPGGGLRLNSAPLPGDCRTLYDTPQLLMQKLAAPVFTATVKITPRFSSCAERAGLVVLGHRAFCIALSLDPAGDLWLAQYESSAADDPSRKDLDLGVKAAGILIQAESLYLRASFEEANGCRFSFSREGSDYIEFGSPFRLEEGQWVGAKVGLFALSLTPGEDQGYAGFERFTIS
ncbi:glycoside hydrolase [Paenibacillus riograndensis]|uniref:Glycoside hydrolase n=1 Tax=Paenibacillus riograndensis TaxID=483937 RepID=A0A132TQX6_9BACL|nr:glycoside hydrolase 43 family protein [Paenibacillus riograndensis]KWX73729.1 glycoside hydrolase [Paenibacillus riograndensis]